MNAPSRIEADPTIDRLRYWHALDRWSVVLSDGRLGIGATEQEALEAARLPDAENVLQVAA